MKPKWAVLEVLVLAFAYTALGYMLATSAPLSPPWLGYIVVIAFVAVIHYLYASSYKALCMLDAVRAIKRELWLWLADEVAHSIVG